MSALNEEGIRGVTLFSLRETRESIGVSLTFVAERAGISKCYLSQIERGNMTPSDEAWASICEALHVSLEERREQLKRVERAVLSIMDEPDMRALRLQYGYAVGGDL